MQPPPPPPPPYFHNRGGGRNNNNHPTPAPPPPPSPSPPPAAASPQQYNRPPAAGGNAASPQQLQQQQQKYHSFAPPAAVAYGTARPPPPPPPGGGGGAGFSPAAATTSPHPHRSSTYLPASRMSSSTSSSAATPAPAATPAAYKSPSGIPPPAAAFRSSSVGSNSGIGGTAGATTTRTTSSTPVLQQRKSVTNTSAAASASAAASSNPYYHAGSYSNATAPGGYQQHQQPMASSYNINNPNYGQPVATPLQQQQHHQSSTTAASTASTRTSTNASLLKSAAAATMEYPYHSYLAALLVPQLIWVLCDDIINESYPQALALYCLVTLYAMDLACLRTLTLVGVWMTVVILTLATAWCRLMQADDDEGGVSVLLLLLQIFVSALILSCAALWWQTCTEWLEIATRTVSAAALHAVVPPTAAAAATYALEKHVLNNNRDAAAQAMPFIFAATLGLGMMTLGAKTVPSAWQQKQQEKKKNHIKNGHQHAAATTVGEEKDKGHQHHGSASLSFLVSSSVAWGHLALLYMCPLAMYLATHLRRIVSATPGGGLSWDDIHDLVLVSVIPYLVGHYGLTWAHQLVPNPYAGIVVKTGTAATSGTTTTTAAAAAAVQAYSLRSLLLPLTLVGLAAVSVQQRYLLRWTHAASYYFFDTSLPTWVLSLYWLGAVLCTLFVAAVWGRKSTLTNQLFWGEYHEDVVQIALSLAGLFLGKAAGLPWNMTPLPVLAALGFTLWMTTRMLRYLCIFLFVVHATGVIVFTYRFAGIDQEQSITLPIGWKVSLIRLGLLATSVSIGVGLVTGLAVRSAGGWASVQMMAWDATGWVLMLYTLALGILEIGLWKRPLPTTELVGVNAAVDNLVEEPLYDPWWAYGTCLVICATAAFMKHVHIIKPTSAAVSMALSVGKALSIYVDTADQSMNGGSTFTVMGGGSKAPGYDVWLRSLVTAMVCVVLFAPRVFVSPVHVKSTAPRVRRHSNSAVALPEGAGRLIAVYTLVFLPCALAVAVPYVVYPLSNAIRGDWRGDSYYRVQAPWSELAGATLLLWGLACLSMLNTYLPDGGGEMWKKLAALSFLMGVGIVFCAPTLGLRFEAAKNPYAAISSLGSQLIRKGKGRTGGWGLLAACFATLLAITGPLELKERRNDAMRKDRMLLVRTMIFGLLFGGGLAWFLVMLCMREASFVFLVLTTICSLTVAFLGTIAAVLGYFVPLEDFSEVTQVFSIWLLALLVLLPVSGLPQLFGSAESHPFGVDGWLSTYLAVGGITAMAFCLSIKSRQTKNPATRGLANTSCLVAWISGLLVLYGRFGVAGMDANYDVTNVMGLPASVFGTIILMPLLLGLEGESSSASGKPRRVSSSTKTSTSSLGINLPKLSSANGWVLISSSTASVFILASLFAIILRGAGLGNLFGFGKVAKSNADVFSSVFGSGNTGADEHDLAALAKKAISHSEALATSAKLAASGFWTASSLFGPLWHLFGVMCCLPSLWFLVQDRWLGYRLAASTVVTALPLNIVPFFLCKGIPSLQAAAAIGSLGGLVHWSLHRQTDHQSRMST